MEGSFKHVIFELNNKPTSATLCLYMVKYSALLYIVNNAKMLQILLNVITHIFIGYHHNFIYLKNCKLYV